MPPPDLLRIPHDNDHFEALGRLPDGTQFLALVTGAFPGDTKFSSGRDWQTKKRWLGVLHCFDAEGNHISSEARLGGYEIEGRPESTDRAMDEVEKMLATLWEAKGQPTYGDIWVKPFSVEIDGVLHGLIYGYDEEAEPEDGDTSYVMLEPRDIMFHPPWDSGEYST